jgi:biopolymer transport protein ExbD
MLIIFMVAAPLKPYSFATKLPAESDNLKKIANDCTLVVTVQADHTLKLNGLEDDMGTVEDTSKLSAALVALFKLRTTNRVYRAEMVTRLDVPEQYRIEKTVFVKAPRSIAYGNVAKVIDGLKGSGAEPVGLQLDDLN